jgi:hypothetical protein
MGGLSYFSKEPLSRGFQVGANWAGALELPNRNKKVKMAIETVEHFISGCRLGVEALRGYDE